jgi:hypothetical protein
MNVVLRACVGATMLRDGRVARVKNSVFCAAIMRLPASAESPVGTFTDIAT